MRKRSGRRAQAAEDEVKLRDKDKELNAKDKELEKQKRQIEELLKLVKNKE